MRSSNTFQCVVGLAVSSLGVFGQAPPAPPAAPPAPAHVQKIITINAGGSFLGVGVKDVEAERAKALKLTEEYGVEVTSVEDDSPAAKAGLKVSDVVVEFNGHRVESTTQFVRMVHETPAGRQVKMQVLRNGGAQVLTATIATRSKKTINMPEIQSMIREHLGNINLPDMRIMDIPKAMMSWNSSMLGVEVEAVESQLAQYFGVEKGVLVRSVVKGSAAEKAGFKAGDVITKVDDAKVSAPRDITSAIRNLKEKKTFNITYVREKREASAQVTIEPTAERGNRGVPVKAVRQMAMDIQ